MTVLIQVSELAVEYRVAGTFVLALDGLDLTLEARNSLGIVGESGSGKTTLGHSLGRLLPPNARRLGGELAINGRSVFSLTDREIRTLRRDRLGFVFQSPAAALDPTRRIGRHFRDVLGSRHDNAASIAELLTRVGFTDPAEVAKRFPHELSGGMAQRVVVAMAIARKPELIVADEPTASLDSSIRNQVLDILFALPGDIGAALVVLTHDIKSVAARCSHVAVMYGGRVVEVGAKEQVLGAPRHPYTAGLLAATPGSESRGEELMAIPGFPPTLRARSTSCTYAPRCPLASATCRSVRPEPRQLHGRTVVCHHAEQMDPGDVNHPRILAAS